MNMKKFLLSFIFVLALCAASSADIVYTTSDGSLGLITISETSSADAPVLQYSSSDRNFFVHSYWNGTDSHVALIDRTTDTEGASGDSVITFRSSNLATPDNEEKKILTGIYNTQYAANSGNGRAIYLTSGVDAIISEFNTSTFEYVRSYEYEAESGDTGIPSIQSIMADYYYVYALINTGNGKSELIRFDGQLIEGIENTMKKEFDLEASSMSLINNGRIAISFPDGINIMEGAIITNAISTDYPVKSVCYDGSSGIYFTMQTESEDEYINTLAYYSLANRAPADILNIELTGETPQIIRDNNVIAVMTEDKILLYNISDRTLIREFDSSELGGYPLSISAATATGQTNDNSSSNCNISGAGIFALLILSEITAKRKN